MKMFSSLKRPSERQQLILIIMAAIGLIAGAWAFSSELLNTQRREIEALRKRSQSKGYANRSMSDLTRELEHEQEILKETRREWRKVGDRLGTYANQRALRRLDVMHIDYKVELIRQRERLIEKSNTLGVELLPGDLGMALEIDSNEVARERMLKLKAVERLADLTLDRRIQRLYAIEPLEPKLLSDGRSDFLKVYPVRVEFDVAFENIFDLLQAVFEDDSVFAFDNIQILAGPEKDAPLRVYAVMKALIFDPPKES